MTRTLVFQTSADGPARCIEIADAQRARRLALAPNATAVRRRKDGAICEIHLRGVADDSGHEVNRGNPRRYSTDRATENNPHGVWKLRHLPSETKALYRTAVLDNLTA
jgi:hypothetical protein